MQKTEKTPVGVQSNTQVNSNTIKGEIQASNKSIYPYKFADLMKLASQIVDKIANTPRFIATYDDFEFVLETVMEAVKKAREK